MRAQPTLENDRSSHEDRVLIGAYLSGDPDAFDELYQRYHPALVRLLTSRLGERATAEDVAQEVMIRAMRSLDRFDAGRPLWPWLRRIAVNAAVDVVRSRSRSSALADALAAMPTALGANVTAEHEIVERDLLDRALQEIPARQRRALERCYVDGWRPTDAAGDFGVGRNAFEQLLHRARRNLRRAYLRHDDRDRAAGMAWLLLVTTGWAHQAVARSRRVLTGVGETTAQAVAAGVVVATIAVAPTTAPPPMTLDTAPEQDRAAAAQAEPDRSSVVQPPAPVPADPSSGAVTADVQADGPAPAPAPVAQAPAPAGDGVDGAGVALPVPDGTQREPAPEPAAEPPASAPEAVGGCGSVVRSVVCDAAQPAEGAATAGLGLGG